MKKTYIIPILCIALLFSCKTYNVDTAWKKIKRVQSKEYAKNPYNYTGITQQLNDSSHVGFYKLREQVVNQFIKEKKEKDFILKDAFYKRHDMNADEYTVTVYTLDSAYTFRFEYEIMKESFKFRNSIGSIYFTRKGDSVYINNKPTIDNYKREVRIEKPYFPAYLSFYRNGELTFLLKRDSVLYQSRKNTVKIDLETVVYVENRDLSTQRICWEKKGIYTCEDGSEEKCKKNSLGIIVDCIKTK